MNDINLKAALCKLADEDDELEESKDFLDIPSESRLLELTTQYAKSVSEELGELAAEVHADDSALEEYCEKRGLNVGIYTDAAENSVTVGVDIKYLTEFVKRCGLK